MPSYKELWPDRWLKAEHLQGRRPTVAVETVSVERLHNPQTRKAEPRLIVSFRGKSLRLILNKTQAQSLEAITGSDDYTTWPGHHVVLSAGIAPNGKNTVLISPVPEPLKETTIANGHEPGERLSKPTASLVDEGEPVDVREARIGDPDGDPDDIPA